MSDQIARESFKEPGMALRAYRSDRSQDPRTGQYGQEPQTNHGIGYEPGSREVRVPAQDDLVKIRNGSRDLRAYPAQENVGERWKFAEEK